MAKIPQVVITLAPRADGTQHITVIKGDLEILVENGELIVCDYSEPREGNGVVFVAVAGTWLTVGTSEIVA